MMQCAVDGCGKDTDGRRRWCEMHRKRWQIYRSFDLPPRPVLCCAVAGCQERVKCRGWCEKHYWRWRIHGDPTVLVGQPKGKGYANSQGYRVIAGRRLEHRVVMEHQLGRPLRSDENVHHINGDRLDNRITNLELWSTSQPKGQRVEEKLAWARDFITRYGIEFVQPRLLKE